MVVFKLVEVFLMVLVLLAALLVKYMSEAT